MGGGQITGALVLLVAVGVDVGGEEHGLLRCCRLRLIYLSSHVDHNRCGRTIGGRLPRAARARQKPL